jgi:hypothetical protein
MDPERIRVRAHFHYENGTGSNPKDELSNWLQAEGEERLLEVAKLVQPHVCALLCLLLGRDDPAGIVAGGSATFVDTGSARLIVTAEHVAEAIFAPGMRAILAAGNGTTPIDISHLRDRVASDRDADVAAICLPDDFDVTPLQRRFLRVSAWPPARARKGDLAFFLGYPGLHREVVPGGLRLFLTPFCDFVTSVIDRQFYLVDENLERLAANLSGQDLVPFGPVGGLSGSVVFANRDGTLEPVGILKQGGEGVDAMFFVAHIDLIQANGDVA